MAEPYSTPRRVGNLRFVYAVTTKVNHSRVLHEIRLFIQTETQRSALHRALIGKTISI
jgi:hypothetical protein